MTNSTQSYAAPWLDVAQAECRAGVREIAGVKHNPRILAYFKSIGAMWADADEVPWCAAFVGHCLLSAGYVHSGSALASSYANVGHGIPGPVRGAIVLLGDGARINHVGFVERVDGDRIIFVTGGNQSNCANTTAFKLGAVMGYRWPTERVRRDPPQAPAQERQVPKPADAAQQRQAPSPEDVEAALRDRNSRTIGGADRTTLIARIMGIPAAIVAFIKAMAEALGGIDASSFIGPLKEAADVAWHALPIIVPIACVLIYLDQRAIISARVDDARKGRNTARLEDLENA